MIFHFVTVMFMSCTNMNSALWCGEPISTEIYVSVPKEKIESLESFEYRFVKSTDTETVARAVMGKWPETHEGCKMTTTGGKEYYFRDICVNLKAGLKKLSTL